MQPALASMLAPALLSARALLAPGALVSRTFATKTPAHGAGLKEHEREAATKGAAERYARISQIFDLTGSTALVTGGSRGIGAAIALGLARSGANIIVADIANQDKMAGVVAQVEALGRKAVAVTCDVRQRPSMEAAVEEAAAKLGAGPDILVASAGIMGKLNEPEHVPHSEWKAIMDTNVEGSYIAARACYPYMQKAGRGKIVLISSIAGIRGAGTQIAYACSKGALLPMARSLAAAWGKDNIQVNTLLPGAINTPFLDTMIANTSRLEYILGRIPAGRLGVPEDMVGPALFLSSPASDYVTGAEVSVDGGGAALPMQAAQDPKAYKP